LTLEDLVVLLMAVLFRHLIRNREAFFLARFSGDFAVRSSFHGPIDCDSLPIAFFTDRVDVRSAPLFA